MKKQLIWKFSACACAALLSACASNEAFEDVPLGTNASGRTRGGATSKEEIGGVSVKRINNAQTGQVTELGRQMVLAGSNVNTVVVDGHTINLTTSRNAAANSSQDFYDSGIRNKYSYVNFGAYNAPKDNQNHAYALAYGQITPANAVPTTGTATYEGNAIINPLTSNSINAIEGTSSFEVDYGNKQINGDVTTYGGVRYQLGGIITSNSFSGNRNGIQMQGRFFGPKAEELGGTFHSTNNINGVMGSFGAKKD